MSKGEILYKRAKEVIPGGTQLLSKRPEMFLPDQWPSYYSKAEGCTIWDLDGRELIDMSYMGIGACILGYADPDVNNAVKKAIDDGSITTLNCPEEVELAELLLEIHPWADMVRYARTGGESMSIAVRIARAATKKDKIIFCGYHGWHDWYLAANLSSENALEGHLLPGLSPAGVPSSLKNISFPFHYNNIDEFSALLNTHKGNIAAVVMESIRNVYPENDFLKKIREITANEKIPFIIDEVSSGFRLNTGGAHLLFDIEPDIAVFAKGMSNGYPMAAIIGKNEYMSYAQESFISSTYWTERTGPAAAIASIRKMQQLNVPEHLNTVGSQVQKIWSDAAKQNDLNLHIEGIPPLGHFSFEYNNPLEIKTLFTQLMLGEGFLATTAFYAAYAHKNEHLEKYKNAVEKNFAVIKNAIDTNNVSALLKGPVCHSGFKRLN